MKCRGDGEKEARRNISVSGRAPNNTPINVPCMPFLFTQTAGDLPEDLDLVTSTLSPMTVTIKKSAKCKQLLRRWGALAGYIANYH